MTLGLTMRYSRFSPRAEPWKPCCRPKTRRWFVSSGITGHFRPEPLIDCIHRYPFDAILMAVNAADPHHYSFSEKLLPLAVEKQMGIIGMKVPARGRILSSWTPPPIEAQKHSWEGMVLAPTPGTLDMRQAMYYSLSLPVSTVIIGCDSIAQLEHNVQLAHEFTPYNEKQMTALGREGRAGLEAVSVLPFLRPRIRLNDARDASCRRPLESRGSRRRRF